MACIHIYLTDIFLSFHRLFIINNKMAPTNAASEPMYCSQQINIPPELPDILKQFTKAAIRTQPTDILQVHSNLFF